jgi:isoprenylcysteine carboxyl methyltransferase (ICMT) family protein YpbQ
VVSATLKWQHQE